MSTFGSDTLMFVEKMAEQVRCGVSVSDDEIRRLTALYYAHDHGEGRDCRVPKIHSIFKPAFGYDDFHLNVGCSKDGSIGGGRIGVI